MILIHGAEIYDPAHGINGQVGDLWVDGEKIVPPPVEPGPEQVIDATGMILAPAGIEIHTHVAGSGLNTARCFLSDNPASLDSLAPPAQIAAGRYLALGYTTIFDAACPPLMASLTMGDFRQMTGIDRGCYTQLGDHRLLLQSLAKSDLPQVRAVLAWLLRRSGGYAVKLVNPGSGIAWKAGIQSPGLDDPIGLGNLTQRRIIQALVQLVNEMGLPHPVHLHAGRLGQPGNAASFCETVRALEGQRTHLCHIQFYSYGQDDLGRYTSAAEKVVDCLMQYPPLTCDVGQPVFGPAVAVTYDTGGLYSLQQNTRKSWISHQLEAEGGVNVMPLDYAPQDATSAVQWATGLELLLRSPEPARLFLTTDHPNGAPFTTYPQIIEWLMCAPARQEVLEKCHPAGKNKTGLAALEREYSLSEIFAMTSWGPAQALGLTDRGHLGTGAIADLRCYRKQADLKAMFTHPAWVMRRGQIVVQDGNLVGERHGKMLTVHPAWDRDRQLSIEDSMQELLSFPVEQYGVGDTTLPEAEVVPCTSTAS